MVTGAGRDQQVGWRHGNSASPRPAREIRRRPPDLAGAVAGWEAGLRDHFARDALTELRTEFSAARDFAVSGDRAYFVLPTTWTGSAGGKHFEEHGAWSFVLARIAQGWKVLGYGWGVTGYDEGPM